MKELAILLKTSDDNIRVGVINNYGNPKEVRSFLSKRESLKDTRGHDSEILGLKSFSYDSSFVHLKVIEDFKNKFPVGWYDSNRYMMEEGKYFDIDYAEYPKTFKDFIINYAFGNYFSNIDK